MRQHDGPPTEPPPPPKLLPGTDLHIDAQAGIAGDMLLAALIDLGVSETDVFAPLRAALPPFEVAIRSQRRRGISCRTLEIHSREENPPRRGLGQITEILGHESFSPPLRQRATAVFTALAQAEGKVHGVSPETVHFHEVGALDSLVDVLGTLRALELLAPGRISCSSLPLGSGQVSTEHGVYPLPAPASLELLRGLPTHQGPPGRELSTPTGVAIARVVADRFGDAPAGCIGHTGSGAGSREAPPEDPPNLVRVWTVTPAAGSTADSPRGGGGSGRETIAVLETHLDTITGEEAGHVAGVLREAGALDAFWVSTVQKKARPGLHLTVLCRHEDAGLLERLIFRESGTLGVRRRVAERRVLPRSWRAVYLDGVEVRVKLANLDGEELPPAPEDADLRRLAATTGRPLREVRARVLRELGRQAKADREGGRGGPACE